jgi:hypothetical protein
MALHQTIQRCLLIGVKLHLPPAPSEPVPPEALAGLIQAVAPAHQEFDQRAMYYGNRYRSGFWAIYLLSAIAVLFAVLPLALGWDSRTNTVRPLAGMWAVCEVLVIFLLGGIYWMGHRRDWQGQWLTARTTAELTWYLPLVAPLVDFATPSGATNWYMRVFDPGQNLRSAGDVDKLCERIEPLARAALTSAWADPGFVTSYAHWTTAVLAAQKHYHHRVAVRQHALLHRVHGLNNWLFGTTACCALVHLLIHSMWLSLITMFFPALGASLHGALAQSEAYRLGATSERLMHELQGAIDGIQSALKARDIADSAIDIKAAIESAIALILEEHQDWHMLVRPHHLPLG